MTDERIARLATVGGDGMPHVVPVTFAIQGDRLMIAIDHKPKTTMNLRRLRNIRENPRVCVLADHYDDDWTQLWWVRADGEATIVETGAERTAAVEALAEKYSQYQDHVPEGPVICIGVTRWSGWSYSGN
ncbi:TIGR03668 family PPOX class F420-dependent oxidoreductase [Streptosporangium sp. CA-115845]|uniref:TIGR03668 family PPOX class F420-dependent oxidoreductase n=1 Tax=Streptosporangium sp. CA-115845 TaxID=3240071 RepID=UPI003D92B38A